MNEKWVEVAVKAPRSLIAIIEKELYELGSTGCVEDIFGAEGDIGKDNPLVKGYFQGPLESAADIIGTFKEFISSLADLFPSGDIGNVKVKETSEEDWQKWKEFFKPVKVSDRVVIKPSWEPYEKKDDEVVVEIDPGMAFGTGTHETTKLCCELLDKIVQGGETVLDVGTGTGILAIAAAKLGAINVLAIDIDERSVEISAQNMEDNRVSDVVEVSSIRLDEVQERFDVIVANIFAEDLIDMKREILERLKAAGKLILSGILTSKADMVAMAYEEKEMKLKERIDEGEWCALLFKR